MINPIKYVVAFEIRKTNGNWYDLDLVMFRIGQIGGQETIDFNSYPWRCTGVEAYDRIGLTNLVGHNDLGSGYIGYEESLAEFIQDIPYADSDDIHYFDLWVGHIATFSTIIKVTIVYSDATHDISYEETQNISTWQHIVFSISFDSNKYITQIQIGLGEIISHNVNIDDVGLWSQNPSAPEYQRFYFIISPTPIQKFGHQVECYLTVTYQFYGYLRNSTGGYNENGTFSVRHNLGSTDGIVIKGLFNFTIIARASTISGFEDFGILVILEDSVEEFIVNITWKKYGSEIIPTPIQDVPWIATTEGTKFIVMMFMVFVPSAMIGFEFSQHKQNGLLGFMIGLALMSSIAFLSGLMPLWFLFLMLIGFVVYIFFSLKSGV